MNEMRPEPPTSAPSPPPAGPDPSTGSLAAGVGLAWLIMLVGEVLVIRSSSLNSILVGIWLPPLAIVVCGIVLLVRSKPRTGKGMFLGLASIFAVLLLLLAACYGLVSGHL